ncbi:uncharacterized protein C6orf229-like [Sinocyclocheilus grahami]|uniref:uncharacterized protein C6orf229-like n=1 Tax=Sinocyclocheilus grahami TaxID=75366 RepID=UPI0007ACC67F|nr:PREDICTED: uncharacterized protein C6orf229-like [Sinocyclocheilus grahami]
MIRFLSSLYDNYIKPYFSSRGEAADRSHKSKVLKAGRLLQSTQLPAAVRADAARDIGILSYTGGYEHAAQAADKYMASMVELLKTPDLKEQHIIRVLEGLSAICYLHVANQDKAQALGLPDTLLEFVSPISKRSFTSQRWSCHLLNILCCHNIPIICHLKDSNALQSSLEKLASLDWDGWPLNYAQELLRVLGFQQSLKKDALNEEDELKGCSNTKSGHMLGKPLKSMCTKYEFISIVCIQFYIWTLAVNMHINYRY